MEADNEVTGAGSKSPRTLVPKDTPRTSWQGGFKIISLISYLSVPGGGTESQMSECHA